VRLFALVFLAISLDSAAAFPLPYYLTKWGLTSQEEEAPSSAAEASKSSSGGLQASMLQSPLQQEQQREPVVSSEEKTLLVSQLQQLRQLQAELLKKQQQQQSVLTALRMQVGQNQNVNGGRSRQPASFQVPEGLQFVQQPQADAYAQWQPPIQQPQNSFAQPMEFEELGYNPSQAGFQHAPLRMQASLMESQIRSEEAQQLQLEAAEQLARSEITQRLKAEKALANATAELLAEAKIIEQEKLLAEEAAQKLAEVQKEAEEKVNRVQEAAEQKVTKVQLHEKEVEELAVHAVRSARAQIEQANSQITELKEQLRQAKAEAVEARSGQEAAEEHASRVAYLQAAQAEARTRLSSDVQAAQANVLEARKLLHGISTD